MTPKTQTHTPTPWKLVEARTLAHIHNTDYTGISLPYKTEQDKTNAAFIVRAVNAHEELLAIVKAIGESFNAGANQVYADALAPHTDDDTLKTWINKTIARTEGK